jgi:hypothetical protein
LCDDKAHNKITITLKARTPFRVNSCLESLCGLLLCPFPCFFCARVFLFYFGRGGGEEGEKNGGGGGDDGIEFRVFSPKLN